MEDQSVQELEGTIRQLTEVMRRQNISVSELSDTMTDEKAERELSKNLFKNKARDMAEGADQITSSFSNASRYLIGLVGGSAIGGAIGALVTRGQELAGVYSEMTNSGQLFQGSILEMNIAAASAGMPLDEFAKATMTSSLAIKQMGDKEWPKMQRTLRDMAISNGNFGLSMDTLTSFNATYLETFRRSNASAGLSTERFKTLAIQTQGLSNATGVAQEKIVELANSALEAAGAHAQLIGLSEGERADATARMAGVMNVFAAQGDKAAAFLTSGMANTFATGNAMLTDQAQELASVGLSPLISQFQEISRSKDPVEAAQMINDFKKAIGQNKESLIALSAAGDQTAKQFLAIEADLIPLTQKEMKRAKELDGLTKFMASLPQMWDSVMGDFKEAFWSSFRPFMDQIGDFNNSDFLAGLRIFAADFGDFTGKIIGGLLDFSAAPWQKTKEFLVNLYEGVKSTDWSAVLSSIATGFAAINSLMWPFITALELTSVAMSKFPKITSAVLTGLGLAGAGLAALYGFKKIKSLFGDNMVVNAASVIVNGADGGMGGMGDMGSGKGGKGGKRRWRPGSKKTQPAGNNSLRYKRGRFGKIGKIAGMGGGAVMGGLGSMSSKLKGFSGSAKGLSMTALKSGVRKIPVIGALAGLGFSLSRAMNGDYLGAAMVLGSGVASTIPGIGTAASFALDGALMAHDMSPQTKSPDISPPKRRGRGRAVAAAAGAVGTAGLAYGASEMMSDTTEEKKPVKNEVVELLSKMNQLISTMSTKIESTNDLVLTSGKSQTTELKNQSRYLSDLLKKI